MTDPPIRHTLPTDNTTLTVCLITSWGDACCHDSANYWATVGAPIWTLDVPARTHFDMSYRARVDEVFVTIRQAGHLPVVSEPFLNGIQIVPYGYKHHHILITLDAPTKEVPTISRMPFHDLRRSGREVLMQFLDMAVFDLNFEYS